MKYRILLSLFALVLLAGMFVSGQKKASPGTDTAFARTLFPEAATFTSNSQPFAYIQASDAKKTIGYAVLSEDLNLGIKGYGGPVPLMIALSPTGEVLNIRALSNNETPSYSGALGSFVQQFIHKGPMNRLELGRDIDAITGATITSDAVTETVRAVLKRFSSEVLHQKSETASPALRIHRQDILFPVLLLAVALTALLLRNTTLRWLAMTGGFIYFGIMTHTMLSIVQVANLGLLNIPDIFKNTPWFMTLVLAFVPAIIIGRIYCGSLCPFALVQEILLLFRKARHKPSPISPAIDTALRNIKYGLLIGLILLCFLLGNASAANIEPFVTLFSAHASKLAWAFLLLMMVLGVFHFRFWCVYLCPVGALTGLVSSVSWWKIRAKAGCTHCGACSRICPTRAISIDPLKAKGWKLKDGPTLQGSGPSCLQPLASSPKVSIDNAECILCGKCLKRCRGGQLALIRKP